VDVGERHIGSPELAHEQRVQLAASQRDIRFEESELVIRIQNPRAPHS
jgi:hypothetical protein